MLDQVLLRPAEGVATDCFRFLKDASNLSKIVLEDLVQQEDPSLEWLEFL